MTIKKPVALILVLAFVAGCGPVPLVPVTYEKEAVVISDLAAYLELNTGTSVGHSSTMVVPSGGIFVPVSTGPTPHLQFGADDQATFVESLKSEMKRLGIVRELAGAASPETLSVGVNFVHTEHFPTYQQYKLTVSLLVFLGEHVVTNRYEVLSSEGDSTWEKWNTNASKGKEKAATKLLDLILTDIQDFILFLQEEVTEADIAT